MLSRPRESEEHGSVVKRLTHVGIVVADIDMAKRFLADVLELELVRERVVPERQRTTAYFEAGDVEIELIEDHEPDAKERALGGATAVIEHIAFEIDDLERTIAVLADRGVLLDGNAVRIGTRVNAWTQPATSGGVMFQLTGETTEESEEP